jgi:predicted transcriptional regulator
MLVADGFSDEDVDSDENKVVEEPPSLVEAVKMVRRLRLLTTTSHPELYSFILQFQSKQIDIYLEESNLKQKKTCMSISSGFDENLHFPFVSVV